MEYLNVWLVSPEARAPDAGFLVQLFSLLYLHSLFLR